MTFSFIIPFKSRGAYLDECLKHIEAQACKDFEIILLPDEKEGIEGSAHVVIPTGEVKPSRKRNIGIQHAKGEIIVFIDDDAYPNDPHYLERILKALSREGVGAVGGPQLTPPDDGLLQHLSGEVLSSMGAGQFSLRYKVASSECFVQELPSCNLAMRKSLLNQIGGFDEAFLTGEDAKLCFDINDSGLRVLYSPEIQVFHHRRASVKRHMKQMFIYGRDKAQVLRDTRFHALLFSIYTIPLAFVIALIPGAIVAALYPPLQLPYIGFLSVYILFTLVAGIARRAIHFPFIAIGIFLSHLSYGIGYGVGVLTPKPKSYKISAKETSQ